MSVSREELSEVWTISGGRTETVALEYHLEESLRQIPDQLYCIKENRVGAVSLFVLFSPGPQHRDSHSFIHRIHYVLGRK